MNITEIADLAKEIKISSTKQMKNIYTNHQQRFATSIIQPDNVYSGLVDLICQDEDTVFIIQSPNYWLSRNGYYLTSIWFWLDNFHRAILYEKWSRMHQYKIAHHNNSAVQIFFPSFETLQIYACLGRMIHNSFTIRTITRFGGQVKFRNMGNSLIRLLTHVSGEMLYYENEIHEM